MDKELLIVEKKVHNPKTTFGFAHAYTAACRSSIKKHKTGAAIFSPRGELISLGWSAPRLHALTHNEHPERRSQHAEHHAIERAHTCLEYCVIYIITITKHGNTTSAIPCKSCLKLLLKAKIRKAAVSAPYRDKN